MSQRKPSLEMLDTTSWNRVATFSPPNNLMRGEYQTLTEEEVKDLNNALKVAHAALMIAEEICQQAKKRFKDK
jgi:hypothetical protein